ncbi:hypothetical protein SCP_0404540 [Sparassis crispa]|uniref:Uncharacterized protein n=1 Tax=Sparassis crispa TaxID=139825 RepID=A0A401GIZ3_9APHY|nr:hypothetical protein SCP_0404540 [Sparassis crispa]GBE82075.1 hypothetical protein SCP_0404540 [Sparassis crispa]
MSRWVFIMGMILLVVIIGAICLGVYVAHKSTSPSTPTAIGGSADETGHIATTAAAVAGVHGSSSTSLHVTPTNTVARRDSLVPPVPTSLAFPVPYSRPPSSGGTRICCAPSRLLGIADAAISIARWADTRDRVSPTVGFCVVRGTGVFDPPTVSDIVPLVCFIAHSIAGSV